MSPFWEESDWVLTRLVTDAEGPPLWRVAGTVMFRNSLGCGGVVPGRFSGAWPGASWPAASRGEAAGPVVLIARHHGCCVGITTTTGYCGVRPARLAFLARKDQVPGPGECVCEAVLRRLTRERSDGNVCAQSSAVTSALCGPPMRHYGYKRSDAMARGFVRPLPYSLLPPQICTLLPPSPRPLTQPVDPARAHARTRAWNSQPPPTKPAA